MIATIATALVTVVALAVARHIINSAGRRDRERGCRSERR